LKNNSLTRSIATTATFARLLTSLPGWALIEAEPQLGETASELVEKLESRHYSKRKFDDEMSSQLLDSYLRSLDPTHSFLYQSDIEEFESYRFQLDDQFAKGDIEAGFIIFNRYQERIEKRLEKLIADLPQTVAAMDFTVDESLSLEPEKRTWPKSEQDADERWRKQLKNAALSLKLAGKTPEEILPVLEKRYQNQLHRISQYNAQDCIPGLPKCSVGALRSTH